MPWDPLESSGIEIGTRGCEPERFQLRFPSGWTVDVRLAFPAFRSWPSDYRSGPLWSRPPSEAFASAQAIVVIRAPDGTDRIDRYGKQPDDYEPEELMGPHTLARHIGVVAELGPEDSFDELYEALARFGDELDHEN